MGIMNIHTHDDFVRSVSFFSSSFIQKVDPTTLSSFHPLYSKICMGFPVFQLIKLEIGIELLRDEEKNIAIQRHCIRITLDINQ